MIPDSQMNNPLGSGLVTPGHFRFQPVKEKMDASSLTIESLLVGHSLDWSLDMLV